MSQTAAHATVGGSSIADILCGLVPHDVVIPHSDGVYAYLEQHPDALPLVVPIAARARQAFPLPDQLSLELSIDPETGQPDLKLYVRLAAYPPDMLARLLSICDPFEEAFAQMSSGWLHVTTDFRPPV